MSFYESNSQQSSSRKPWGDALAREVEESGFRYEEELAEYRDAMNLCRTERFSAEALHEEALQEHNIRLISNQQLVLMRGDLALTNSDCLFSVVQTHFYGLEYVYEVLFGPFLLRLQVLNLNRDSDDGDEDIEREEIGAGGFGSVRGVRIKSEEFAIKRLPFGFKLEGAAGYDFEAESNEQVQLRRCLREFCLFKICSLLGVGPRVVRSSYDLVCFNNCVEFRMELCEPVASAQFFANHEPSLLSMRAELLGRLARLHSLNIVHRDLKPENLLYSSLRKAFLLADFGMSVLVRENWDQRTLTAFAGTPEYCGEEMRQLLNGQRGLVNLYLNDYSSLKAALGCLEGHICKASSEISMNNMSYREENYDDLSDFENFSIEGASSTSRTHTDSSYPSTGQSLANLTSASTEAPKKLATSINHHECEIIFLICRRLERNEAIDYQKIQACVEDQLERTESQELFENLCVELGSIFFASRCSAAFPHQLKEWKNKSRHYGPASQHAVQMLEQILRDVSAQPSLRSHLQTDVREVRQEIIVRSKKTINCQSEMKLYRILGHHINYAYSLVDFLRYEIQNKDKCHALGHQQLTKRAVLILKQYLFCIKLKEVCSYQLRLISHLAALYINDPRIQQGQKVTADGMPGFSYAFLKANQLLDYEDLGCYILYKLNFTQFDGAQVRGLMEQLKSGYGSCRQEARLSVIISSIALNFMSYHPSHSQTAYNLTEFALSRYEQHSPEALLLRIQLMIYFNALQRQAEVRRLGDGVTELLERCKGRILHHDYYRIINAKIIGESYIYSDRSKSQEKLKGALQELIRCYGLSKHVHITFQIFINLIYIYFAEKKMDLSQKYLRNLRIVLEGTDRVDDLQKKIYVYQLFLYSFMQVGIKTASDEAECSQIVSLIISHIGKYVPPSSISSSSQLFGALRRNSNKKVAYFIERQLFKVISRDGLKFAFSTLYLQLSLSIAEYLFKEARQLHECLKYLWKYIEFKEAASALLTEYDYQVYNMFASILMSCNSYRRAIIFLKRYIFRIPKHLFNVRKKAFEIMYKASVRMNEKMTKIYYELTKNNSSLLFQKDYDAIFSRYKSNQQKKLLQKWLEMV